MRIAGHDVGVCSWSLQPHDTPDLVAKIQQTGLQHVQLALGEWVGMDDGQVQKQSGTLQAANIQFTGGMMAFAGEDYSSIERIRQTGGYVPDAQWPLRKRLSIEGAKIGTALEHSLHHYAYRICPSAGELGLPAYAVAHH